MGPFLVLVGYKRTLFCSKETIYAKNVKFHDFFYGPLAPKPLLHPLEQILVPSLTSNPLWYYFATSDFQNIDFYTVFLGSFKKAGKRIFNTFLISEH